EHAKRHSHWDADTWELTPFESGDGLPTDEVWMVRVSMAASGVTVAEPGEARDATGYPRPGWAWGSVRWRRLLWWRRQYEGGNDGRKSLAPRPDLVAGHEHPGIPVAQPGGSRYGESHGLSTSNRSV